MLALFAAVRDLRRAIVPTRADRLASGWSALVLFVLGIPLNPMSATLGALVIAVSTEFSVLLSERYRQERRRRATPDALGAAYRRTGAAVLASGVTVIAGVRRADASDIPMLRDFGLMTVVDLASRSPACCSSSPRCSRSPSRCTTSAPRPVDAVQAGIGVGGHPRGSREPAPEP